MLALSFWSRTFLFVNTTWNSDFFFDGLNIEIFLIMEILYSLRMHVFIDYLDTIYSS